MTAHEISLVKHLIDSLNEYGKEFGYTQWEIMRLLVNEIGLTKEMFKECDREGLYLYYETELAKLRK
jgi:hypothetical protein